MQKPHSDMQIHINKPLIYDYLIASWLTFSYDDNSFHANGNLFKIILSGFIFILKYKLAWGCFLSDSLGVDMCTTVCGCRNVSNNVSTSRWLSLMQRSSQTMHAKIPYDISYTWREFLIIKVKHWNTCVAVRISRWNQFYVCQLIQSPSLASHSTLCCLCRGSGSWRGIESYWWIICLFTSEWHRGVWIKGLLSCFSIREGCQEKLFQQCAQ